MATNIEEFVQSRLKDTFGIDYKPPIPYNLDRYLPYTSAACNQSQRCLLTVHVVVPYCSDDGRKNIGDEIDAVDGIDLRIYSTRRIPRPLLLNKYAREMKLQDIILYQHGGGEAKQCEQLLVSRQLSVVTQDLQLTSIGFPIYFDHKVANDFASYPMIYLEGYIPHDRQAPIGSLLRKLPSRSMIEFVQRLHATDRAC
jgi:hypothetical protein